MTDGTYRVELAYAPDGSEDPAPWRARIYGEGGEHMPLTVCFGSERVTALLHARQWIKTRNSHGDPETVLLDRNGDIVAEKPPSTIEPRTTGWSVRVP